MTDENVEHILWEFCQMFPSKFHFDRNVPSSSTQCRRPNSWSYSSFMLVLLYWNLQWLYLPLSHLQLLSWTLEFQMYHVRGNLCIKNIYTLGKPICIAYIGLQLFKTIRFLNLLNLTGNYLSYAVGVHINSSQNL